MTLLEMMIVIILIAILASVAVPMLLKSRVVANEVSAISTLKVLFGQEATYYVGNNVYGTLADLKNGKYVDQRVGSGEKDGYKFEVIVDSLNLWHAEAIPMVHGKTGLRSFYVDESGSVLGKDLGETAATFKPRAEAKLWPSVE